MRAKSPRNTGWAAGLPSDEMFDLLGDYNDDLSVNAADGNVSADGDEGRYVDAADEALRIANLGNTLTMQGISLS